MTEKEQTLEALLQTLAVGDQVMLTVEKVNEPAQYLTLRVAESPDGTRRWKVVSQ